MEIKVGDKVRVSKDAPGLYLRGWGKAVEYNVYAVDGDAAIITYGHQEIAAIPTKYLVKVEEEAKEPKFEVGDVVRLKDIYYKEDLRGRIGIIRMIAGCHIYVEVDSTIYPAIVHSIEPYTEPTEDEIIRQREAEFDEFAKEELDRVHHPEKYATYEVTIDNVAMDWEKYTADLAKEIAIVYAKQKRDVRMAVRAAKSVVEELKKK